MLVKGYVLKVRESYVMHNVFYFKFKMAAIAILEIPITFS